MPAQTHDRGFGTSVLQRCSVQRAETQEHFTPAQAVAGIHSQQPYGGATRGSFPDDPRPIAREVPGPLFAARMEQGRHLAGVGIDAGQVRALLEIALWTGEREVLRVIGAAMLPRDDVLDVETEG